MPDLAWNKRQWNAYSWVQNGEEWSAGWGSAVSQWYTSLLPRLQSFLPARSILEIAPGRGRWTQFLLSQCDKYTGIDLSEKCIDYLCDTYRETAPHASFHANDGLSLEAAAANTPYDLIFSFDSLVHVGLDVLQSYISQIFESRLLSDSGVGIIHHSNLRMLIDLDLAEGEPGARDHGVSYVDVRNLIKINGGHIIVQELYNWEKKMLDCITLFCDSKGGFRNVPERLIHHNIPERELGKIYECYNLRNK